MHFSVSGYYVNMLYSKLKSGGCHCTSFQSWHVAIISFKLEQKTHVYIFSHYISWAYRNLSLFLILAAQCSVFKSTVTEWLSTVMCKVCVQNAYSLCKDNRYIFFWMVKMCVFTACLVYGWSFKEKHKLGLIVVTDGAVLYLSFLYFEALCYDPRVLLLQLNLCPCLTRRPL